MNVLNDKGYILKEITVSFIIHFLVSLFNGILTFVGYAKAIIGEEQ